MSNFGLKKHRSETERLKAVVYTKKTIVCLDKSEGTSVGELNLLGRVI